MRSGAEGGRCPHCKAEVPPDHGRVCLECGGSLQKRYLSIGCLTSKPIILFAVGLPFWIASRGEVAVARDTSLERAASATVTDDGPSDPTDATLAERELQPELQREQERDPERDRAPDAATR